MAKRWLPPSGPATALWRDMDASSSGEDLNFCRNYADCKEVL